MADKPHTFNKEGAHRIVNAVRAIEQGIPVGDQRRSKYPIHVPGKGAIWGKLKVDQTAPYQNVLCYEWTGEPGVTTGDNPETQRDPTVEITAHMPETVFYQGNRVLLIPCASLGDAATHIAVPLQCPDGDS